MYNHHSRHDKPCCGLIEFIPLSFWYAASLTSRDRPTVSLGVTSAVVDTYGCNDGRIAPTRCAIIAAGLGDRWSRCRGCSRPPAGAGSARIAPAATSRPASTFDPGGSLRSRTIPPSATTPCDEASRARSAPATRPCRPRPCLFESWLQYREYVRDTCNFSSQGVCPVK